MRRRDVIVLFSSAAIAWPLTVAAQRQAKVRRIVWVSTETQPDPFVDGFRQGLRERGYVEGKDVVLDLRYAPGNPDALRPVLAELTGDKVDLAVSSGPAIRALRAATGVPVLFAISGDPVEIGLVKSLARPEGNFTGATFLSLDLAAKRVDLLKDIFPKLRRLAVLSNTDHPGERSELNTTRQAAQKLGIELIYVPFVGARELDDALATVARARADAILVFPEGATMVHRAKVAQFAVSQKLPSMFGWSEYADAGGLLSYGANQRATYLRLATYADRIFRGESPANLPVEQPTTFELVVNLKTAKALGIEVPTSILLGAARTID
jgi:putative ABC transport system substrate-binding protein